MKTLRTLTITDGETTRPSEIVEIDGVVYLREVGDTNNDGLTELADDSDSSVNDVIADNGFEIVEAVEATFTQHTITATKLDKLLADLPVADYPEPLGVDNDGNTTFDGQLIASDEIFRVWSCVESESKHLHRFNSDWSVDRIA